MVKKTNIIKIILFLMLMILPILNVSAAEATIEYQTYIKYSPDCSNSCTTQLTTDPNTNQITNVTTCENKCYWNIDIKIKHEGEEDFQDITNINTSKELYQEAGVLVIPGKYYGEFGNSSTITGLNEKLDSWNDTYSKLLKCQDNLRTLDFNLTNCISQTGYSGNYTIEKCTNDNKLLQSNLEDKNSKLIEANANTEKEKSGKTTYLILGVILGIILIKFIVPAAQGKTSPKDSSEEQFPSNSGY